MQTYDVIIIGAGHAGVEAAAAAARVGARVLILTKREGDFGALSCNPSIGGPGKSQMVAEMAALGGVMPKAADYAGIHFRMLNASQGPATQALRAQIDRARYHDFVKLTVNSLQLTVIYEPVTDIDFEAKIVNNKYSADAIVIAVGTFLNGMVIRGDERIPSGRLLENGTYQENSPGITDILRRAGFEIMRLKTGTPPRLYADSIDFSKCEEQAGEVGHSFCPMIEKSKAGIPCYITRTTEETHQIIRDNIKNAPMYNGNIKGIGARYCPSIEDKVMRFPEHKSHHIFLEPDGGGLIYPMGISTSFGADVQDKFLRTISGLENVRVARYGYAIEYDAIDARDLTKNLESKKYPGIYFAGQINGTSGYEEAAAQGLVAGASAAQQCLMLNATAVMPTFLIDLNRTNSMIGVLIDDITTNGIDEPYRMFSSRAEYRLSLRADNAIVRLGKMAVDVGLLAQGEYDRIYQNNREKIKKNDKFYAGYIKIHARKIEQINKDKAIKIPPDLDYNALSGLTNELKQKLSRVRPATLADAARIQGMTPAGMMILLSQVNSPRSTVNKTVDSGPLTVDLEK